MKKTRIIRILILIITLPSTKVIFHYLDKECHFLGQSIIDGCNVITPIGIKVSLYMGCPSTIEFIDALNNNISCDFSYISNPNCTPHLQKENMLLSYWVGDSNILLCKKDTIGKICYTVLKRGPDSFFHEEIASSDDIEKTITSPNEWTNVTDISKTTDARNCCVHLIIMLIALLIFDIGGLIFDIRKYKKGQ